jgi:hypothetical protein
MTYWEANWMKKQASGRSKCWGCGMDYDWFPKIINLWVVWLVSVANVACNCRSVREVLGWPGQPATPAEKQAARVLQGGRVPGARSHGVSPFISLMRWLYLSFKQADCGDPFGGLKTVTPPPPQIENHFFLSPPLCGASICTLLPLFSTLFFVYFIFFLSYFLFLF